MRDRLILIVLGFASFAFYLGITNISTQFNWGEGYEQRPIPTFLILYFVLFLFYALAVKTILEKPADRGSLWIILVSGLLFRAAILPSQPIQEDDVYRYLWDGKVFANAVNPYEYSPKEVDDFPAFRIKDPQTFDSVYDERQIRELTLLNKLKWENETALTFKERVNHPDVPTIYPPLMQYVFRLVHQIRPDSIATLRLAFLLFDLAAVAAVIRVLSTLGKNRNLCLAYFWSPLLIKETYNSTHLDVVGISMLCVSILFLLRVRYVLATVFLALGVLGKFYPAILLPLFLKTMLKSRQAPGDPGGASIKKHWPYLVSHCLLFLGVILVFYLPFLQTQWKTFTGLKTFTTFWQNNDSIFSLLVYFYGDLLGLKSLAESFFKEREILFSYNLPMLLSKVTVAMILAAAVYHFTFRQSDLPSPSFGVRQMFILMALVFLLSPAQYPWYFNWVLPFLCLFPSRALILLSGLLGLYYLDFYFSYQNMPQYSSWIPWLEYTPAYLLLVLEIRKSAGTGKSKPVPPGSGEH